jgi:phosphocarrier protein FPr
VPILLGLGVDELSVALPAIPTVKAQIRSLRMDECRALAARALAADSAEVVRALLSTIQSKATDEVTGD